MKGLDSFLDPALARTLPLKSSERAMATIALKSLWHLIFDPCGRLLKMDSPDGSKIFDGFLEWAKGHKFSMNWTLHLHLLEWLCHESNFRYQVDAEIIKELLAAAAARWAKGDISDSLAIFIASRHWEGYGICGLKGETPVDPFRVVLMKFPLCPGFQGCLGYYLSHQRSFKKMGEWLGVPV